MSHNNRVLYVNTPLDRKTRWAERTTQKVQKRIRVLRGKENAVEMISPGLWVLNPATILESINMIPDGKAFDLLNRINNKRFAHEIKKAALMLGFKDYILFNDSSMFLGFYQKELLMPAHYIYYMRDNLMQVPFWRKHGLRLEPDLISKADVIVNNSLLFTEYGKKFNDQAHVVM